MVVKTVKFHYENEKEEYQVCEKMPIIATTKMKEKNIYNAMELNI